MTVKQAVVALVGVVVSSVAGSAAAQQWTSAKCELNTSHFLVQGAVQYLKNASETKFQDKRVGYLKDASRVLTEAVTTKGQDKNPAAWYYFGRYYALTNDMTGADTAFTKALALAPLCKEDISVWRRVFWVPVFNEGVKAWQAGNTDSAIASFRRANQIYQGEPTGFVYLGTLFANANQPDSSAKYFKLAVPAASDPKFAKQKRDALFNVARVYHAAQRHDEAIAGYKQYLDSFPGDVQALAGLAAIYSQQGKRSEAGALYGQILEHADSAEANDLFSAAQAVLNAIPNEPGPAPVGSGGPAALCRGPLESHQPREARGRLAAAGQEGLDAALPHHRGLAVAGGERRDVRAGGFRSDAQRSDHEYQGQAERSGRGHVRVPEREGRGGGDRHHEGTGHRCQRQSRLRDQEGRRGDRGVEISAIVAAAAARRHRLHPAGRAFTLR